MWESRLKIKMLQKWECSWEFFYITLMNRKNSIRPKSGLELFILLIIYILMLLPSGNDNLKDYMIRFSSRGYGLIWTNQATSEVMKELPNPSESNKTKESTKWPSTSIFPTTLLPKSLFFIDKFIHTTVTSPPSQPTSSSNNKVKDPSSSVVVTA